ncbi:hypothetical protein PHLCEN_2v3021 [Hermanssonia centrifuga]|uniref:Arrestin-like N-terminal domain-containing protein n=1 Tax=Hermanssonia centrifuga TaxID=98765 RepID=A0A2R6R7B0_9APHY|nr:hypothetical protein PHLCEN_2v3021 [Hermanssonia centrifuga]
MEDTNINPSVPPAYSPPENSQAPPRAPREPTIHLYELRDSKSRPWAVLKVASNAASSAQLPHVYEGESIVGSVNLDLEKGVQIKSISITVSGAIITTNNSVHTFVCITKELWSTAFGDPAAPPMTTGSPFKGKIQGQLSWPFSISLPAEVDISFQRSTRPFKLPASFYARGARVTVHYRINVAIIRGRFQTDYKSAQSIGENCT